MKTYTKQELEQAILTEKNSFKLKSLKEKLSWILAKEKGQFVKKEDLIDLKPLIIFLANKWSFYKGQDVLKSIMTELLETKIVFRTKKGIKGAVTNVLASICSNKNIDLFISENGSEYVTNSNLRMSCPAYNRLQQFNLNINF